MADCEICGWDNGRRRKCAMCSAMACIGCRQEIGDGSGHVAQTYCEDCFSVYDAGHACGYGAGTWMDMPEIGETIPRWLDHVGYRVVTEENLADVFTMLAYESELGARDFSPWEFTAKEINDRCADLEHDDLWELYDLGVEEGIAAAWAERDPREED